MTAILTFGNPRRRIARVPLLFRARECEDEDGIYALSYGKRVGLVHARAGATGVAAATDRDGRISWMPADRPRLSWEYTTAGARVRTLLLEPASTNLVIRSHELDQWSLVNSSNITCTPNAIRAPDGSLTADLLLVTASTGSRARQDVTVTADGTKVMPVYFKNYDGGTSAFAWRTLSSTDIAVFRLTWAGDVPTVVLHSGSGTVLNLEPLVDGWWRAWLQVPNVLLATANNGFVIYPSAVAGAGGLYVWQPEIHESLIPTSPVRTGAATATRAVDSAYFPFVLTPRVLSAYVRQVNVGAFIHTPSASRRFLTLGFSNSDTPYLILESSSADPAFGVRYADGATTATAFTGGATTVPMAAMVECLAHLTSDWRVRATRSVDGAAPTISGLSAASGEATAWNMARAYFMGNVSRTPGAYADVLVTEGEVALDECRELCEVG